MICLRGGDLAETSARKAVIFFLIMIFVLSSCAKQPKEKTKTPSRLKWKTDSIAAGFKPLGWLDYSPVIANGIVYLRGQDGLYALDAKTGKQKWMLKNKFGITTPCLSDGVIYMGGLDGIFAIDAKTGKGIWYFKIGHEVDSKPAVADGTVYFGCADSKFYAVDSKTGGIKWVFGTKKPVYSTPTVAKGVVYFGGTDNYLYALDAKTGAKKWVFKTGGIVDSPIVDNSTLYFGSWDNYIYALNTKTGRRRWKLALGSEITSAPAIDNATIYCSSWNGNVYALDAKTGTKKWAFERKMLSGLDASPVVDADTVYVGIDRFYALDARTGKKKWDFMVAKGSESPCISSAVVSGGAIYFISNGVYALRQ